MSLNCLTRVSSGTRARSRAARTSASIAASLPISFFFSLGLAVVKAVAGVVVTAAPGAVAAATEATVVSVTTSVLLVSALSPSTASVSFNFLLFRTSFSPLDSDTVRLLAAAASSVFDVSDAIKSIQRSQYNFKCRIKFVGCFFF